MDRLAAVCERIASHSSRRKKVALLADYLRNLDDADLARAVRFLCCGPAAAAEGEADLFGVAEVRKLSLGGATLRDAALAATGIDLDLYRICHREVGDSGETISLLLPGRTRAAPMSLADAERRYGELLRARSTADKVAILRDCFTAYAPPAIKYFVKIITGNLRIGLMAKQVEEALALAAATPLDDIRDAENRLGDLPAVALAARRGELHRIETRLFHPMEFMLAKPLDSAAGLPDPEHYLVEDKYDGIRSQAHVSRGRVALFTRGMEETTRAFPEIEAALAALPGPAILDGELLGWREGRALPFGAFQQRIARKRPDPAIVQQVPAVFVAYDLLYCAAGPTLDWPVERRQAALRDLVPPEHPTLLLSQPSEAATTSDLERLFEEARAAGNEGVVLKRRGSVYESGKRSGTWLKLKRPFATLDVVVTAAEQGSGRRATVLSDYTFGVRSGDGFANIGKAYSGLTDAEVRELTRLLRSSSIDKFGPVLLVHPRVVLEVAFDGIQASPRHKSGFALRFPRIVRWRRDKKPEDADTIHRVRELYESSLNLTARRDV